MSKNFELMQRAGKGWEVPSVLRIERPEPAPRVGTNKERTESVEPVIPIPIRRKTWEGARRLDGRLDVDQLAREESHRLAQQVFLQTHAPARAVVFAGIDHGNGCSRICAQVAEALESNCRGTVCLVEGNLRSPSLPRVFGLPNHHGLTDCLLNDGPVRSFAKQLGNGNLWLLSSGSLATDGPGLLNSHRLKARFEELRSEFDYIVVDAPPLTHYSDAVGLGRVADGLVLILEANSTRREAAVRISKNLRAAQIPVLGAVLNKRTFPIPDPIYRKL